MSVATGASPIQPEPQLAGQTVVVIGGSAGIGLETARRARAEGAKLILGARNPERLERVSRELGTLSTVAFDATNFDQLKRFFDELPTPIDHVLVTGPGPYYAPLAELDFKKARRHIEGTSRCRLQDQSLRRTNRHARLHHPPTSSVRATTNLLRRLFW